MVLKSLKSDPPGTFCLVILQPESLSKICMTRFWQVARDGKSVIQIFDRWSGYKIIK